MKSRGKEMSSTNRCREWFEAASWSPIESIPRAVCFRFGPNQEWSACFNPETFAYEKIWSDGFVQFSDVRHGLMDGMRIAGKELKVPQKQDPYAICCPNFRNPIFGIKVITCFQSNPVHVHSRRPRVLGCSHCTGRNGKTLGGSPEQASLQVDRRFHSKVAPQCDATEFTSAAAAAL